MQTEHKIRSLFDKLLAAESDLNGHDALHHLKLCAAQCLLELCYRDSLSTTCGSKDLALECAPIMMLIPCMFHHLISSLDYIT